MPKQIVPTPSAPPVAGPYSMAVRAGDLVFLAGQIPIDPETGEKAGDDIEVQTRQVLDNVSAVVGDAGGTLDDVVKTTVFLADIADAPKVNEIYAEYFATDPPARSAFQAANLPMGVRIEIEAIANLPQGSAV